MRTNVLWMGLVSVLCAGGPVWSQTPPAAPAAGAVTGVVDAGARGTSGSGDEARYDRYGDLRTGVFSHVVFGQADASRLWSFGADNVGYRNQEYRFRYVGGNSFIKASWDSTPLNYSNLTSTPWVEQAPDVFTLDSAARGLVQNKAPGIVGVPSSAAQLATPSIFRGLATPFEMRSRRDTASASVLMDATRNLGWTAALTTTHKGGNQPYGASFAFNNANELPITVDHRTNDVSAGLEYTREQGMMRLGWQASWFTNAVHELIWDNPLRQTDTTPFDASGYSNGNGPARGRMAMPPSNHMSAVSVSGLYKMPAHTTLNGVVSYTAMGQNDALIPWTINDAIANAGVYASYPGLARLPRATAEASVHGVNGLVTLTTRPNRVFGVTTRYRFNDHRNLTPAFDATNYVRFDATPSNTGGVTEQFDIRQNTFDTTASINLKSRSTVRVGYTYDDFNRTGRAFSDMHDFTVRASLDHMSTSWLTVRLTADRTSRVGSGFSEASLEDGGLQPGLRFYDEADRDRNRGTALVVVSPVSAVELTLSATAGKDVYKGAGHEFGLLDNSNRSINAGISFSPSERVSLGITAGREAFNSLQRSRNANPPGSDYGSWTDPNRTWDLTNDEHVNVVDLFLDLTRLFKHLDLRADYTYSDSDNAFVHSGPRIDALSTNAILTAGDARPCAAGLTSCFEALPPVTNAWHRLSLDARHMFTARVGLGLGYWYERFDVQDFARVDLPGTTLPRIDYLGEVNTGYGNRPYRGSTVFTRLLYRF